MEKPIFKVIFQNHDQIIELFCKAIYQSDLYGFIEIEEYVFGERSQLIVDPAEEKLKSEFSKVKRSFIPLHNVIRIDEVAREGLAKSRAASHGSTVSLFPVKPSQGKPT